MDSVEGPGIGSTHASATSWELSGRQRTVVGALNEKHVGLGAMYAGACLVLQSAIPDRLAMAGHSIRELMEKLPNYIDVPADGESGVLAQPAGSPSLKAKVNQLAQQWMKVSGYVDGITEINGQIKTFHLKTRQFFEWYGQSYPTRRTQLATALRKLDLSGRPLPEPIEDLRVKMWDNCRDFFQSVAHHGRMCAGEEFDDWLYVLEGFLLDYLRPRTFDDFTILDGIIEEGERDA